MVDCTLGSLKILIGQIAEPAKDGEHKGNPKKAEVDEDFTGQSYPKTAEGGILRIYPQENASDVAHRVSQFPIIYERGDGHKELNERGAMISVRTNQGHHPPQVSHLGETSRRRAEDTFAGAS